MFTNFNHTPMKPKTWTDTELTEAVASSYSVAEVLRKLNLAIAGGSYAHIQRHIKRLNLDTSHFGGQAMQGRFGKSKNKSLDDILVPGSPYQSTEIRRYILKAGLKSNQCELCNLTSWHGSPITIELHHKNGVRNDNRLENLQMLCPNCHSQQ